MDSVSRFRQLRKVVESSGRANHREADIVFERVWPVGSPTVASWAWLPAVTSRSACRRWFANEYARLRRRHQRAKVEKGAPKPSGGAAKAGGGKAELAVALGAMESATVGPDVTPDVHIAPGDWGAYDHPDTLVDLIRDAVRDQMKYTTDEEDRNLEVWAEALSEDLLVAMDTGWNWSVEWRGVDIYFDVVQLDGSTAGIVLDPELYDSDDPVEETDPDPLAEIFAWFDEQRKAAPEPKTDPVVHYYGAYGTDIYIRESDGYQQPEGYRVEDENRDGEVTACEWINYHFGCVPPPWIPFSMVSWAAGAFMDPRLFNIVMASLDQEIQRQSVDPSRARMMLRMYGA